jgi:hypothetical protein
MEIIGQWLFNDAVSTDNRMADETEVSFEMSTSRLKV